MRTLLPRRRLGLDWGTGALKAALVGVGPLGARLLRTERFDLGPGDPAEAGLAALERATAAFGPRTEVILGLDAGQAFFHWLDLPRLSGLGPAKRRQAAAYALEGQLPVGLEELTVEPGQWRSQADGRVKALAWAVRRTRLEAALDLARRAGLTPAAVSLDAQGLLAAARAAGVQTGVVVDLGQTKTTVLCLAQGALLGLGLAETAGRDFEARLAPGAAGLARLTRAEEVQESFGPLLDELSREVTRIVRGAYLQEEADPLALHLCGGLARLPGLGRALSQATGLAVAPLQPLGRPLDPEFIPAVGLALAGLEFNLARDRLQAPPSRMNLALASGAVALTLTLAGVNFHVSLDRRRVALANLVQAEEQVLKATLPHLTRIVSPLSQMRAELDKAKAGLGGLKEDAPRPVLDLLLTLERLGRANGVELAEVSAEGGRVILDGRAASFEALAAFQAVLAKEPGFGEVTRQAARQDGPKVLFKVRFRR